eukprot:jgi/Botrbrau1/11718/Bobra.0195s0046.1
MEQLVNYYGDDPLQSTVWPNFLHPRAPAHLEQRWLDDGLRQGTLETTDSYVSNSPLPPNMDWMGPRDRTTALKPLPLLESWVQEAGEVTPDDPIPRELLRELLLDSVPGADSEAVLYGNRLEAAMLSSTCLALLSPCGPVGERLRLSVLQRTQPDALPPFIETSQVVQAVSGAPIYGLHLSPHFPPPPHPVGGAPAGLSGLAGSPPEVSPATYGRLLAVRTPYWLCVQRMAPVDEQYSPAHGGMLGLDGAQEKLLGWSLAPVAALATRERIMDVAWNRILPNEVAHVEEDGRMYLSDVAAARGSVHTGLGGETYEEMRAMWVGNSLTEMGLPQARLAHRFLLSWLPHARLALAAAGQVLLRYDMRGKPGTCQERAVHVLPAGDSFRALAGPRAWEDDSEVPLGARLPWGIAGPIRGSTCEHLMAAATNSSVLLFDTRRLSQPLITWDMRAGDPIPNHNGAEDAAVLQGPYCPSRSH